MNTFQSLGEQLDKIKDNHDKLQQRLFDQKDDAKKRPLIQEIDKWEKKSIKKIKQTADHCRAKLVNYTNKFIIEIENKLNNLAQQLEEIRQKNEFSEIDLNQLKEKLKILQEELDKPSNVSIQQESKSFINKISVITPWDTKWKQLGITIAGGNGFENKLNSPVGILIDDDQTIYIADQQNHRIVEWKPKATNGRIVAGGNGEGDETNQLNYPTDVIIDKDSHSLIISDSGNRRVMRWSGEDNTNGEIIVEDIDCYGLAMDKNGSLYVSDWKKNEVIRWKREEEDGTTIAGGNEEGNQLNQLHHPTYIFVDDDDSLYVSDQNNHRVMKWLKDAEEGIVVAGGNREGNRLTKLSEPQGIVVDQFGQIYVAEWNNHRVTRWFEGAKEGTIIVGENGKGQKSNQLYGPTGLSFDRQGNLFVADHWNHRIQKFEIDKNENNLFE